MSAAVLLRLPQQEAGIERACDEREGCIANLEHLRLVP